MKYIYSFFTLVLVLSYSQSAFAQCGPTFLESNPKAMILCQGITDTVAFSATGTCAGDFEFQVLNSSNSVIQAWSTNDQYISTNLTSETYFVETRCSTCPGVVIQDTFLVEIIQEPTITADTFICHGNTATVSATEFPNNNITWWDNETIGNQLIDSSSYTTPPLFEDDTIYMQVDGTASIQNSGSNAGSILITEAGLHGFSGGLSADYLEISNLYSSPVNTAGWSLAISNSYTNINLVNTSLWSFPNSFAPCTMISVTDVLNSPNYWGNNMFWNPSYPGWAAIIDDQGNLVDFVAWGWTLADLAGFAPTIAGNVITLGSEWSGISCDPACTNVGPIPYSLSRNGSTDTNTEADFVCQATSLDLVNPGLNCGWGSVYGTCTQEVIVHIDSLPFADTPDTTFINCISDVPAPDPSIITNVMDDYTASPTVSYVGEVSDGNTCPEILTRTYQVADSCNFVEIYHVIVINDTVAPVLEAAPADLTVACYSEIPTIGTLTWTDNCMGSGNVLGTEVSGGSACAEVYTRTWTITDSCGNSATQTQVITVNDTIAPIINFVPADLSIQCPSNLPPMATLPWTDNCGANGTISGVEVSDGQICPETITRTWTIADNCGNTRTEVQVIVLHDDIAPTASDLPSENVEALPLPDISLITDATDNCSTTPVVEWVGDDSDFGYCPENVVRTYSVTDDCGNVAFINQNFSIGDSMPNAAFTANPTVLDDLSNGWVQFQNQSTGASAYTWDFGDNSPYVYDTNTTHQYNIGLTTTYEVRLAATSDYGCTDSATIEILVVQGPLYFIPNAFTPNNDVNNQLFTPIFVAGFNPNDFNFQIYNQRGKLIFESFNPQIGWDGKYKGTECPEGTYVYRVEYGTDESSDPEVVTGHINLLR
ncbi:HYR-like domain-containing protein [Brumimicrobium aurantiacum]|uniref:HYR-like domain-containing protein n=1 Tax=Brumimicrobium aurantiacum TaxID=1737063 RepID=UPI000F4EDB1B|nr:T9SS type B sorting domain-containing protein [Brumimicrobium aurantiacum]